MSFSKKTPEDKAQSTIDSFLFPISFEDFHKNIAWESLREINEIESLSEKINFVILKKFVNLLELTIQRTSTS